MEKSRYQVVLDGREYTIVGQYSQEHIEAVVEIVNQQLEQLAHLDPNLSTQDRALLMAVNAVSDQLRKEQTIQDLEEQMNQQLSLDIDEPLVSDKHSNDNYKRKIPFQRD